MGHFHRYNLPKSLSSLSSLGITCSARPENCSSVHYNAVDYCVAIGIDSGILPDSVTIIATPAGRHAEADDGFDAAVEVKDSFAARETGVFPDLGVEACSSASC